jgi:hypothetical protein
VYRLFWGSTIHGVGPLSSRVVMISTVRLYILRVLTSQRRSSSMRQCLIQLGSSCYMEDVTLNLGIWEGSFPFRAFARVVEPRRSNDEVQHKQSCEAPSDATRCFVVLAREGKLHRKPRRSSYQLFGHSLISTTNAPFIVFLCFPSFVISGRDFF